MALDTGLKSVTQGRQTFELPGGRKVLLSPLVLRDVSTVEQECLRRWKKIYMQSVTESLEFLPESMRDKKLADCWDKMLGMTNADLPKQKAKVFVPLPNGKFKRDAAGALVQEEQLLPYEQWWVVATNEGRLFSTWLSIRKEQPDITLEFLEQIMVGKEEDLAELADMVGELTKPSLGNESSLEPEAKTAT